MSRKSKNTKSKKLPSEQELIGLILDNNLKAIKKADSDLKSLGIMDMLSKTNQYGEPFYLIAKRLGYSELADFLFNNTADNLKEKNYKTSPVKVLYKLSHFPTSVTQGLHKVIEAFAFHPQLSKILLPRALESIDNENNNFGIIYRNKTWDKAFNEFGAQDVAYIDFGDLVKFTKNNRESEIPYSKNTVKTFLDIHKAYQISQAIFFSKFEAIQYYSTSGQLIHELTHDLMRILFKDKTSVPYGTQYGRECLKDNYLKAFQESYQDMLYILDNKPKHTKNVKNVVIIEKGQAPSGKELSFTKEAYALIYKYGAYIDVNEYLHEEAAVLYPVTLAENISLSETTVLAPLAEHHNKCVEPAIETFVSNHKNCNLLQGVTCTISHEEI